MSETPIIEAEGLRKFFPQEDSLANRILRKEKRHIKAVNGVNISIRKGETTGVIGESGCGKSTLGRVLIHLQEPTDGKVIYQGQEIENMNKADRKSFRRNCQMIFQNPYESINPQYTVQTWVQEPLKIHGIEDKDKRVFEALERVELTPPENYLESHPHQLSGGERQRVSIARALVLEPTFLVADEPVSMLDVSIRASILNLLNDLVVEMDMAALYISHDLSLIRQMCNKTKVMYLGKFIEEGKTEELIESPKHPYTQALVDAVPIPDPSRNMGEAPVEGEPPDPVNIPEGCDFRPRCPYATDKCLDEPNLSTYSESNSHRRAACWHVDDIDPDNG